MSVQVYGCNHVAISLRTSKAFAAVSMCSELINNACFASSLLGVLDSLKKRRAPPNQSKVDCSKPKDAGRTG